MAQKNNLRWQGLDIARGVTIFGVVIFHFIYDLQYFGFYNASSHIEKRVLMIIAGSGAAFFIFISGLSLQFWHINKKIDLNLYFKRLFMVFGSATLISAYTFLTTKNIFVYMGILHLLSVCSLLFLFIKDLQNIWIIMIIVIISCVYFTDLIVLPDSRTFAWIGLSKNPVATLDYYPLFPWLIFFLVGVLTTRYANSYIIKRINKTKPYTSKVNNIFIFLGKRSLLIYLTHQPILFAFFYAYMYLRLILS